MKLICLTTVVLFLIYLDNSITFASDTSLCGDWEQYKDEHCYKLFDGLRSFSNAKKVCNANNSSMVSIHYAEEQNYLTNYIFIKNKTVDNVWIGAKYNSTSEQFRWADNSTLNGYSNWAAGNPKNLTDHCVEMLADEGLEGKWAENRCAKSKRVVCQRMPLLPISVITQAVIKLKHSLQQTVIKLVETESKLEKTEQSLIETKKEFVQLKMETTITIPIGFIYVQLPKDKAPSELWPNLTWQDISKDYEGVFFRVVGGDAASFGQVQQGNAPRLGTVHGNIDENIINPHEYVPKELTIPMSGYSEGFLTGGDSGKMFSINFKLTNTSEVRPKNMAIKVYRRFA